MHENETCPFILKTVSCHSHALITQDAKYLRCWLTHASSSQSLHRHNLLQKVTTIDNDSATIFSLFFLLCFTYRVETRSKLWYLIVFARMCTSFSLCVRWSAMGERRVSGWFVLSAVFLVLVFGLFFTFTERKTWPEHRVELGPMDMRLVPPVSTVWCEAVALYSDHSFVAYQVYTCALTMSVLAF